ncbi:MAG: flavodoxin family protein [archaeon]|nr:flavodoxin family protein [archaeon]
MKVTILVGSARKEGNTDVQCQYIAGALTEKELDVNLIYPSTLKIRHCNNCNKCMIDGHCYMNDDMRIIYGAFDESDLFILATPVYFSGPSSIIKQVIDRFQCKWTSINNSEKRRCIALLCSGGSKNTNFENVVSIAKAFAFGTHSEWAGEYLISNTDIDDLSKYAKSLYQFSNKLYIRLMNTA